MINELDELMQNKEFTEAYADVLQLLKETKQAAIRAAKAKSAFLANISHELRTPMNAVMGFAQMLNNTPLTDTQKDYVSVILDSGLKLQSFINDLLELSNFETGKVEFNPVPINIHGFVSDIWNEYEQRFIAKELQVHSDIPASSILVKTDKRMLRRVLSSILDNALKFTEQGSVRLQCLLRSEDNDSIRLHLEVADTGIGIHPDRLHGIFNLFEQADDSPTRRYGGTGLGLGLCKRIVNYLNGSITVESEPNVGSRFIVSLPVNLP